jgi:hypothetical protein
MKASLCVGGQLSYRVNKNSDASASREGFLTPSLLSYAVIAGLDPAIHAATRRHLWMLFVFGDSAWTTGSSPVVTRRERVAARDEYAV